MSGTPGAYGHNNEKKTPRKSLLSDFTDAKGRSEGQERTMGYGRVNKVGVEKRKREGEGDDGQRVEGKKSKTGEERDKPTAALGSRDGSDSIVSQWEQEAVRQTQKQTLRREIKAFCQGIRDIVDTSPAYGRPIHDRAAEIEESKLVAMYTEKLAILGAQLSAAPSAFSSTVDVLRAEEGGEQIRRIYDQMIIHEWEELQQEIQKKIDKKETAGSDRRKGPWEITPLVFPPRSVVVKGARPTLKLRVCRARDKHPDGEMQ